MRFGTTNVRKRDTRVTVRQQTDIGRAAYENGRLKTTGFSTFQFWGDVTDMMDNQGDIRFAEFKRLDSRVISISADSRSITNLTIGDTLTLDNSTDTFEVIDIYDSTFRYTSTIIAKYKR